MIENIDNRLTEEADSEKAKLLARFFKTGEGEYGQGDKFLGIQVPKIRKIAKEFENINFVELQGLLNSKIHEKRLLALIILVSRYKKSDKEEKKEVFDFYLKNTGNISNWDLVDLSAPKIVGNYLIDKKREILYQLARSDNLWERRISVLATFEFIRHNDFEDTIRIAESLLNDEHDLIHKAVGWMLREIGKRDEQELRRFLNKHYKKMPRTMLRYSIEKFDEETREKYMKK